MNLRKIFLALLLLGGVLLCGKTQAFGDAIKAPDVFRDGNWGYIGETVAIQHGGAIQSMCVTKDYIICCENASNKTSDPDTLVAFYKNDYDEDGNPVEQYSYAMHITEMDYEHGNGMAYDIRNDKIAIASGPVLNEENLGTVYVLNGTTLKFEEQIQVVSDGGKINAIAYWEDTAQYVMLYQRDSEIKFILTDDQFRVLDTVMPSDLNGLDNFQEFCISGDYLVALPYIRGGSKEYFVQVYSMSERTFIGSYPLVLEEDMSKMEPEGLCEISKGHFIIGSILRKPKRIGLYSLQVPVIYNIQTSIENGKITKGKNNVNYGEKFKVTYKPKKNYEVTGIQVDGEEVEVKKFKGKYTFDSIQDDHTIQVVCTKIPKVYIAGSAVNGSVDAETVVRRGQNCRVNFKPDEHYEVKSIFVDGKLVDHTQGADYYELEDVQENHTIHIEFQEIPQHEIVVDVKNGTTSTKSLKVYQNEDYQAVFVPREDYILDEIVVDGEKLELTKGEDIDFYDFPAVKQSHKIEVTYRWRYIYVAYAATIGFGSWIVLLLYNVDLQRRKKRNRKKELDESGLQKN